MPPCLHHSPAAARTRRLKRAQPSGGRSCGATLWRTLQLCTLTSASVWRERTAARSSRCACQGAPQQICCQTPAAAAAWDAITSDASTGHGCDLRVGCADCGSEGSEGWPGGAQLLRRAGKPRAGGQVWLCHAWQSFRHGDAHAEALGWGCKALSSLAMCCRSRSTSRCCWLLPRSTSSLASLRRASSGLRTTGMLS